MDFIVQLIMKLVVVVFMVCVSVLVVFVGKAFLKTLRK